MLGSQTLRINLSKLGNAGDDAVTVLRLAMAAGDIQIAIICMDQCDPERTIFNPLVREAATLYFVRLQCGHINEAMDAIQEIEKSTSLRSVVSRLPSDDRDAYKRLLDCTKGRPGYRDFQDCIGKVRHQTAFHYDRGATKKALGYLARAKTQRLAKMTRGLDINHWRFHIADLTLKVINNRVLWNIDTEKDVEQQLKELLGYMSDRCQDLSMFARHFVWEYLKEYPAV